MHDLEEITMKPMILKGSNKFWYTILILFFSWLFLFYFHYSDNDHNLVALLTKNFVNLEIENQTYLTQNEVTSVKQVLDNNGNVQEPITSLDFAPSPVEVKMKEAINIQPSSQILDFAPSPIEVKIKGAIYSQSAEGDSCLGKYIYVHDLPSQFNEDIIKHCELLSEWTDLCRFIDNFGLGPMISDSNVLSDNGWFNTNQFMLEVIFHNKMKEYKCLTKNSSLASAIFVPYYSGLDVVRYLWNTNNTEMKDRNPDSLVKWLREKPEWGKLWGRDHFMVAGRITWDFRRQIEESSGWGNRLMILPESKNMTFLTIESSPWGANDFAIPYPSYFHPSSDNEIYDWQDKIKNIKRHYLFSFAGSPKPNKNDKIRGEIIAQCQRTRRKCNMLNECNAKEKKCYNPVYVLKIFQDSVFCLQPPGDSYTRRSTFDSILAGCIPVFFHPGSAYVQYLWHLPRDYTKYSVFIPENEVKKGKRSIERILSRIPESKRLAMKEEVLKLIPGLVYANPSSSLEIFEDAFDITIDEVLERVEKLRQDIRNGKNLTLEDQEAFTWKKYLFGTVGEHEWDNFFRIG